MYTFNALSGVSQRGLLTAIFCYIEVNTIKMLLQNVEFMDDVNLFLKIPVKVM